MNIISFYEKINFFYLPKAGVDIDCCCCSMEWWKLDGCTSEFIAGMLVIFSSWLNTVLNSSSSVILDQSAAPGTAIWVWTGWIWWLTEGGIDNSI